MLHCGGPVTASRLCEQQAHEASLKSGISGVHSTAALGPAGQTEIYTVLAYSFTNAESS